MICLLWRHGYCKNRMQFVEQDKSEFMEADTVSERLIPFWEETYNVMTFSIEPNRTIREFEYLLDKQSIILEVGCGDGQNVLYPAEQEYSHIDPIDISENGIAKLKKLCELNCVNIYAFVQDLTSYAFEKQFIKGIFTYHTS